MNRLKRVWWLLLLAVAVSGVLGVWVKAGQSDASAHAAAASAAAAASVAEGEVPASAAQPAASASPSPQQIAEAKGKPKQWMGVPRVWGHLTARQLGLVINTADPYSVAVGDYYVKARKLQPDQVLRLELPVKAELTLPEFEALTQRIAGFFGERTQALALAWTQPYAVGCNSITGALALGYDPQLCQNTCGRSKASPYFNSASSYPYTELGMRPSMLLAASDVAAAKKLIDRGLSADGSLAARVEPLPKAHFVATSDEIRSQRQFLFPPSGEANAIGVDVKLDHTEALKNADKVLIYMTGRERVDNLDKVNFLPGALADHLTSFGGKLTEPAGQMSVLSWIDAGATASYGAVSEPCAHLEKFPHPQALLLYYAQGSTAIEAYWKSVAWPQQGVFIGEPLAAPFSRPADNSAP